jgi:hypothetical protein
LRQKYCFLASGEVPLGSGSVMTPYPAIMKFTTKWL